MAKRLKAPFSKEFRAETWSRAQSCLLYLQCFRASSSVSLFDPIEYRQAVSEPPQNEPESLGARPPAFIGFLHGQIIGGLERRRKWGWDLNFSIPPVCGAGTPRCGVNRLQPHIDYLPAGNISSLSASLESIMY